MKHLSHSFIYGSVLLTIQLLGFNIATAQNVGIGTASPLEKLHVIGNIRSSTLAGVGNRIVLADINGTLLTGTGATSPAWMVTGNNGLNGGTISTTGTNFMGTTDNQNICFRTNNIERVRISNLGEFFVGTFNTVIAGDLMNAVGNPTFPWAVNGYVPAGSNGGGVYGNVQSGNTTIFGGVQGEYQGTSASGAGVRGIALTPTAIGVQGQESTLFGWAGLFNGDVGSTGNYFLISDRKVKKDIQPFNNALAAIKDINVYSYSYNTQQYKGFGFSEKPQLGLMADEIEQILPAAVASKTITSGNLNRTGSAEPPSTIDLKAVNYMVLIPLLLEGMKEQQAQIMTLQEKVASLEAQLNGQR